ncbi:MAG: hypothetical protein ACLTW9_10320 [Enterocloster sp.]
MTIKYILRQSLTLCLGVPYDIVQTNKKGECNICVALDFVDVDGIVVIVDVAVAVTTVVVDAAATVDASAAAVTADAAAAMTVAVAVTAVADAAVVALVVEETTAVAAAMISVPAPDARAYREGFRNGYWEGFNDATWGNPGCGGPTPRTAGGPGPAIAENSCGCNN